MATVIRWESETDTPRVLRRARTPVWFWFATCGILALLLVGAVAGAVLEPHWKARNSTIRLQSRGARVEFNEASLPTEMLEGWRQVSSRKLAVTASAISCEGSPSGQLRDEDLIDVRAFPNLRWLDLRNQDITSQGLNHLAGLNLEALTLTGTQVGSYSDHLAPLNTLSRLQVLNLSQTDVTDADVGNLTALYQLMVLDISGTKVSMTGIAPLKILPKLESLKISNTRVALEDLAQLEKFPALKSLEIDGQFLKSASAITALKRLPKLRSVEFKRHPLTELDVGSIQQELGPKIRVYEVHQSSRIYAAR